MIKRFRFAAKLHSFLYGRLMHLEMVDMKSCLFFHADEHFSFIYGLKANS